MSKKGSKKFTKKANKTLHKQYNFSTTEIWNADHAIVNFSYQILKKYKKSKRHGYPAEFKIPKNGKKFLIGFSKPSSEPSMITQIPQ